MKKVFLSLSSIGFVFVLSSCTNFEQTEIVTETDCKSKCEAVSMICPEEIQASECPKACDLCTISVFDKIKEAKDCNKLNEKLTSCNFPVVEANFCESACQNYNNQCLTLVPNADKALFDQGFESCMNECKDWNQEKITCMEEANDCPSMTIVCGL